MIKFVAGKKKHLHSKNCKWIFVDIGFSCKQKTCGIIFLDSLESELNKDNYDVVLFSELMKPLPEKFKTSKFINLVIEAPLSAYFENGNPAHREFEIKRDEKLYRGWYYNSGASTMLAASFLLSRLNDEFESDCTIRLFEGFVSFKKSAGTRENEHIRDVEALVNVLKESPESVLWKHNAELPDYLRILGLDEVPPVIVASA